MADRWPNLFLVGAPKAGTTSLAAALGEHPQIDAGTRKEPRHLCSDVALPERLGRLRTEEAYLGNWTDPEAAWRMDGTTLNLVSEAAAERIHDLGPGVRVVVLLRDPVQLLHSYHAERLRAGVEGRRRLQDAWDPDDTAPLGYASVGSLEKHVRRYLAAVGSERLLVLLFDDLLSRPSAAIKAVTDHLALAPMPVELEHHNRQTSVRSVWLQQRLTHWPGRSHRRARRWLGTGRYHAVIGALLRANTAQRPTPPLDPDFEAALRRHFAPTVDDLEQLLDRDLGHWRGDTTP